MSTALSLDLDGPRPVEVFDFQNLEVRVSIDDQGEPWFVAADVAGILGYRMASDMTRRLDPDEKGHALVRTPGGPQTMTTISESGLYEAVFGSSRQDARTFRRWVTGEVLPAIRRTGRYETAPAFELPQSLPEALRLAADLEEQRAEAERRALQAETAVQTLAPAAEAWEGVASADGDFSLREAAQMLCRAGVDTGQNRLSSWLRTIGWTDRSNRPYQQHVDLGRLATRTRTYPHPHTGVEMVQTQLRVTAKGVARLVELAREDNR